MYKKSIATVSLLFAFTLSIFAEAKITSFYSSTAPKHVASLEDSEREEDAEIDYFTDLCPGYGGYELIHSGGDLRSVINIKLGKKIVDLYDETMKLAPGQFAHKANNVVEWRGRLEGKNFIPHAIIYRLTGATEPDDNGKRVTKTNLIVIALNKGNAKVLGAVSGKNEQSDARKLADSILKK